MKEGISQEKRDWMKEVGIKEFDKPMKFYAQHNHHHFSEEYIANTPLEKIKAGYESTLPVEREDQSEDSYTQAFLTGYTIQQRIDGEEADFKSLVHIDVTVFSPDTRVEKFSVLISEIREFLHQRNERLRQSQHSFYNTSGDLTNNRDRNTCDR